MVTGLQVKPHHQDQVMRAQGTPRAGILAGTTVALLVAAAFWAFFWGC